MIDINIYQGKVCINSPNEGMQENNHTKEEKKHEVSRIKKQWNIY